ncbi:MAG TPA: CsgG/HfaB family protein [Macellibacteroides fermentans]|uniref:CsgG/HfaB family protein n=1 Tax=Macellibacteroides fermentans TaxID=879969 RepID=UPI002BC9FBB7|nr:CsgG/HfaB family protein [Macellibacteroides fermentans]
MNKKNRPLKAFFLLVALFLSACGTYMQQPLEPRRASLGPESPAKRILLDLPEPKEKIVTAVYKFRDQTGQYKPSDNGANWSTAVTQGATTILIRVLEESGWFIPIERENISNLLNERKIIRSSRTQYEKNEDVLLPPLLFAGVILEGGIISYETNVLTGGSGVRYMGISLSGQYREDRVSIYIRAVSTSNGQVLKTVYTTKSILSQEVSAGVFKYVSAKRLLEAETGFTYNEPTEICITEAIEKAVESLIIEGVKGRLWSLKSPADSSSVAFANYEHEKDMAYQLDPIGRNLDTERRGWLSVGAQAGTGYYSGDFSNDEVRPKVSLTLGVALNRYFSLDSEWGFRNLRVPGVVNDHSYFGDLSLRYVLLPFERFSPFVLLGGGYDYNSDGVGLSARKYLPKLNGALGIEYMVGKKCGLTLSSGVNYYLDDRFDGSSVGKRNDLNWGVSLGVRLYFLNMK